MEKKGRYLIFCLMGWMACAILLYLIIPVLLYQCELKEAVRMENHTGAVSFLVTGRGIREGLYLNGNRVPRENYIELTEKRLANARTTKVKDTLTQTQKNQREAVATNVKDSYSSLILARSNYEQARQAFDLEKTSMDTAERKLSAGTITRNAYETQKSSYLTAEVTVRTRQLDLLKAMVDYQWAVDGLASAS